MTPPRPIPGDTPVLDAAREAARTGVPLITDGRRTVLSPVIPPGWHRLGVTVRETRDADLVGRRRAPCDV